MTFSARSDTVWLTIATTGINIVHDLISTILQTSINPVVATKLSAPNASCRSSGASPRPPISYPNLPHALIVSKRTLASSIRLPNGGLGSGVRAPSVLRCTSRYDPHSDRTSQPPRNQTPPSWPDSPKPASDAAAASNASRRRRKSFGYNDPEVVTVGEQSYARLCRAG